MELYVHLPFCKQKCRYCDFPSRAGQEHLIPAYLKVLLEEGARQDALLNHPSVSTVFIGGGTPSLLSAEQLSFLLTGLRQVFDLRPDAEFTAEANPGTLTVEWLDAAVSGGINRLSMGMQAAQPHLLRTLGRIHDTSQVRESVRLVRQAGVNNLNLDLMFGLPGQTEDDWLETLQTALELQPNHLSCYGLIVEEGTPIASDIENGLLRLPDEETERRMYDTAITLLAGNGLRQYEISNFALPGDECRHNLGYWRQIPYLGLGASAASMLPDPSGKAFCLRISNPPELRDYLSMMDQSEPLPEVIPVSREEARFETMMLGLRTIEGVSEDDFQRMHGVSLSSCYGQKLNSMVERGLLNHSGRRYSLTRRGMDIQNSLLVELMD